MKDLSPATSQLTKSGIEFRVHEYEHDPAAASYGDEAVAALQSDPAQVFKTLVAELDTSELVVAVVPIAFPLQLKALASVASAKKARMAALEEAQRSSGYVAGGISPFGQRKHLRTFVDQSAQQHETVYVSAGRRGVEVEVPPGAFSQILGATWASLT